MIQNALMTYNKALPRLPSSCVWTLSPREIKEDVPEGDWIDSQDDAHLDPLERVLSYGEKVLSGQPLKEFSTVFSRTHADGWTITGEMHNDWYSWVEDFEAEHPEHGKIVRCGIIVTAPSKAVLDAFERDHPFREFDYRDI